jgi:hypothetical protein
LDIEQSTKADRLPKSRYLPKEQQIPVLRYGGLFLPLADDNRITLDHND